MYCRGLGQQIIVSSFEKVMQSEKTLESLLANLAEGNVPPPKVTSYEVKQEDTEVSKVSDVQRIDRKVWLRYRIRVQGLIKCSYSGERQDFK